MFIRVPRWSVRVLVSAVWLRARHPAIRDILMRADNTQHAIAAGQSDWRCPKMKKAAVQSS